jgi:hypothetical protein
LIASVLTIPVNNTLHRLTTLKNVAQLDIRHALLLALISIFLPWQAGIFLQEWLPKKIRSQRSEVSEKQLETA